MLARLDDIGGRLHGSVRELLFFDFDESPSTSSRSREVALRARGRAAREPERRRVGAGSGPTHPGRGGSRLGRSGSARRVSHDSYGSV